MDHDPNDFDDFKDSFVKSVFNGSQAFRAGHWNGKPYSEMDTSHLLNCVNFAKRRNWPLKAKEVEVYLKSRVSRNEIIQKNEFVITEEMLIELAHSKGVKIPKSGAGAYIKINGVDERLEFGQLAVKFDVTKTIPPGAAPMHSIRSLKKSMKREKK